MAKFNVTVEITVDETAYDLDEGETLAAYIQENVSSVLQDSDTEISEEGATVTEAKE